MVNWANGAIWATMTSWANRANWTTAVRAPLARTATLLALTGSLLTAACGSGNGGGAPSAGSAPAETGTPSQPLHLPPPGTAWVVFGTDTVLAEVASLPDQRERGLMDRDAVPDGTGMLFVFPESEERSFWMRDTHVSLDIAFFDAERRIAGIEQMEALDETLTDSNIATALVLEVRRGWFAERGIEVGATAEVIFGPGLTVR